MISSWYSIPACVHCSEIIARGYIYMELLTGVMTEFEGVTIECESEDFNTTDQQNDSELVTYPDVNGHTYNCLHPCSV